MGLNRVSVFSFGDWQMTRSSACGPDESSVVVCCVRMVAYSRAICSTGCAFRW